MRLGESCAFGAAVEQVQDYSLYHNESLIYNFTPAPERILFYSQELAVGKTLASRRMDARARGYDCDSRYSYISFLRFFFSAVSALVLLGITDYTKALPATGLAVHLVVAAQLPAY